ncbi:MAG: cation-translocating P-type ATPase [Burkholderiaceae bacterium]
MAPDTKTPPRNAWHALSSEAALGVLESSPTGLSAAEAAARLAHHGPNVLRAGVRVSAWALLASQFRNVLILILLAATAASALLGHTVEAVAITVIVLLAVLLGFFQEYRAERAIEALREMAAPHAVVLRDGREIDVAARDIVPGDVVLLSVGNRVPADGRLLEAVNLQAQEAALTGESMPVDKHSGTLPPAELLAVGDRRNLVFAGTTVAAGRGRALVVATAMDTEFGRIAGLLETVEVGRTLLQLSLDRLGRQLARAALIVVLVIAALGIARGEPVVQMLIFAIALAVAVVPEALPAVVTISLALGVQRLSKRRALMRRLPAIETLGSTTLIATDKTGTLTLDQMTVRKVWSAHRMIDVTGNGLEPAGEFIEAGHPLAPDEALQRLLAAGLLASDADIEHDAESGRWVARGDPTESALVVAAGKAGLWKAAMREAYPRVQEIPFSSETKRMTTLHRTASGTVAFTKGAPEAVLERCMAWLGPEGEVGMDEGARAATLDAAQALARQAMRVLAVASRTCANLDNCEEGLTLLGLVGMIDPPRPEVPAALAECAAARIRVVMITGDHPLTAAAIAHELGIGQGRTMLGSEVEAMDDQALTAAVDGIDVFARVSPAHKLRVVTALQARGHVVAMTGDGVNDAPALKRADIGVAMGVAGTDVAREAAAMTLTDDNFASIVAAVREGRAIYANIKKYLMFLLSSNIGEIGLMAGAMLLGMPLPLSAVQILYVNLATDGLPALALAIDPADRGLMQRPPRDARAGIFTRPVVVLMLAGGVWSTLVNLGLFGWALRSGRGAAEAMTMTFVSLVLIQFLKAYNFRSDRTSILVAPFRNRWLNLAIAWELALLTVVVYLPWLQEPFGTFSLTVEDAIIIVLVSATIVPVLESVKWLVRRGVIADDH